MVGCPVPTVGCQPFAGQLDRVCSQDDTFLQTEIMFEDLSMHKLDGISVGSIWGKYVSHFLEVVE